MTEFELSEITQEGENLLAEIKEEFQKYGYNTDKLPQDFSDTEDKIKLVFVGQYSAGKSSIIKMLTGEDVKTGADITTQTAAVYPWRGMEIVDTPGIHTELRPDHDKLTYEEINHAALLVFVITNEGFSQKMGEHFRNLALEQKRAQNMVLAVNKMDRTALGNTKEQQEIIIPDLAKVTAPYEPEELYLSFLDTTAYFDSLTETDESLRQELLEISGNEEFIVNLNRFVAAKGILAKLATPLYTMANQLRDAINGGMNEPDKEVAEFVSTIERRQNMIEECKRNLLRDTRGIAEKYRDEIVKVGRGALSAACGSADEAQFNDNMAAGQRKIESVIAKSADEVEDKIRTMISGLNENIKTYDSSSSVQKINTNLMMKLEETESLPNKTAVTGALTALAGVALKFNNPAAVAAAVPLYANIAGKGAGLGIDALLASELGPFSKILSAGAANYVTKFLTPTPTVWQEAGALFARNASKVATALGAATVVYGIYANLKESELQESADKARRDMKTEMMGKFNHIADEYFEKTMAAVNRYIGENIDPIAVSLSNELTQIHQGKEKSIAATKKFRDLLAKTEGLVAKTEVA